VAASAGSKNLQPARVTGTDGKSYPATHTGQPAATSSPATPLTDNDPPTDTPQPKTDALGHALTPEQAEAFGRRGELWEHKLALKTVRLTVVNACKGGDPLYAEINWTRIAADLEAAEAWIDLALPYARCPFCNDGCKNCLDRGWVGKPNYERAPKELKK